MVDENDTSKEQQKKLHKIKANVEDIFSPNSQTPEDIKSSLYIFMLDKVNEFSQYYKGNVEINLSDLQDDNADNSNDEEIKKTQKLHKQLNRLERASRKPNLIIEDLKDKKDHKK